MKKAIIFDMDGLMIDSERVTWEGYQQQCRQRGYNIEFSFYKRLLGYPMGPVRQMLQEHFGADFPLEEVIKAVHDYVEETFISEGVPKKPGLMELLEYARENKFKTVVATSSDRSRVQRILKHAGIEGYFDGVVCGDEVTKGKPSPDIFLEACRRLAVTPDQAYVIEDSETGVQAAYAAGIDVICVPDMKPPGTAARKMAYRTAASLYEAADIIKQSR